VSFSDQLIVHTYPLLCLHRRFAKLASECSSVRLYCVTIAWSQIFKGSLQVTVVGVLLHVTVERRHLGR